MNRREMFIRSGLGLVALSTLPALASIKSNQRNSSLHTTENTKLSLVNIHQ